SGEEDLTGRRNRAHDNHGGAALPSPVPQGILSNRTGRGQIAAPYPRLPCRHSSPGSPEARVQGPQSIPPRRAVLPLLAAYETSKGGCQAEFARGTQVISRRAQLLSTLQRTVGMGRPLPGIGFGIATLHWSGESGMRNMLALVGA